MSRPLAATPLEGDRTAAPAPAGEERVTFEGRALVYRVGGRWRSEGQRQLWIRKGNGANAMANRVLAAQLGGVTERYVSMLLSGERQPAPEIIARAWIAFGIPGETWGLAPKNGTTSSVTNAETRGR
jgi:hypothetical protein